jgi:poly(3-hydroxybutyrate) depolymerase
MSPRFLPVRAVRLLASSRPWALLAAALALGACSADGSGGHGGFGGATSSAGHSGAAGSGSSAGSSGSAGAGSAGSSGSAGSAGASGSAGSSGSAGAAAGGAGSGAGGGAGGTIGGAAGASPDGGPVTEGGGVPSAGCGITPTQPLMTYTKYTETVPASPTVTPVWQARDYFVWLPANYNPKRAYPTVVVGPGCGGSGDTSIKIQSASGDNAIVVGLNISAKATGRDCFMTESATSPEIDYFDETLKQVEAHFCVDKSKVFMEGFSSGSWLTNLIGCARADVLRGQGNASGCTPAIPTCKGPIAYMEAHDTDDPNNSYNCGIANRDRIAKLNQCGTEMVAYDPGPGVSAPAGKSLSCIQYKNCKPGFPVVFCTTSRLGHTPAEETHLSTNGFWTFWTALP